MPLTSQSLLTWLGGKPTASGAHVNEVTALGLPAVWRALQLTSSVPASLPFKAYKTDDDTGRVLMGPSSQATRLMNSPHVDMTPFEFWQLVHVHRKAWGNAYCLKDGPRDRGGNLIQVQSLWPLHPSRVRVWRDRKTREKLFAVDPDDRAHDAVAILTERDVLHIPGMGYDGVCGVSPIRVARESIGLGLAAQEFGGKFFGNGSLASGVLQTEQRLTQPQADALSDRWRMKRSGVTNAFDTIVLDKGAKFTQLSIPSKDAQFLESRRFQVTEVCRWFGLPPFLMFETETSTSWGTGLEQQALAWVTFDLLTDLMPVEQRISRLLFPAPAYAKHSVEGLLRGDPASRSAFYTSMWNIGAFSTNEIRAKEELGPIEGGDVHYRPLNMGQLGQPDPQEVIPA